MAPLSRSTPIKALKYGAISSQLGGPSTRGVAYWPGDKTTTPSILFGTSDGHLISLDANTGEPQRGFGETGIINLRTPDVMNGHPDARYDMTSPPILYKNLIITGAQVQETPELDASGDTHAWDVHTGKLVWRFHNVPREGETGNETWPKDAWKDRSGTNVWGLMSIDTARGLLFMPIGASSFDFYGADRKGNNLFANSLVALHADTGKLAWYFQTIHHDIQDYDLQSAPVLVNVGKGRDMIPAVAVIGKAGLMYMSKTVIVHSESSLVRSKTFRATATTALFRTVETS